MAERVFPGKDTHWKTRKPAPDEKNPTGLHGEKALSAREGPRRNATMALRELFGPFDALRKLRDAEGEPAFSLLVAKTVEESLYALFQKNRWWLAGTLEMFQFVQRRDLRAFGLASDALDCGRTRSERFSSAKALAQHCAGDAFENLRSGVGKVEYRYAPKGS